MVNVNEFERMVSEKFPKMTTAEVVRLAELGKEILSVSDDIATDVLFVIERILKSDSDLIHDIQYCLSDLIKITRLLREYEHSKK